MKTGTKVTHTPGPWTFYAKLSGSENHRGFRVVSLDFAIGDLIPIDGDGIQGKANATLVAAAPDMLEVLEAITVVIKDNGFFGQFVTHCGGQLEAAQKQAELVAKAEHAIAKAKGGAE